MNEIKVNDYIEGYEYWEDNKPKKIKGWVDQIRLNQGKYIIYDIQADDEWNGTRGTFITTELGEVVKLENKSRPESRC